MSYYFKRMIYHSINFLIVLLLFQLGISEIVMTAVTSYIKLVHYEMNEKMNSSLLLLYELLNYRGYC